MEGGKLKIFKTICKCKMKIHAYI